WEKSIVHFTRALGAVRSGDLASSKKELSKLVASHQSLLQVNEAYKANQVQIQIKTVSAWISLAEGRGQEALQLMEEAVDMEFKTGKHAVTPGEVLPAGELLGDLLMEMKNPEKALKAYERDLQQHPNRLNGLYGAATAARTLNENETAAKYFKLLVANTKRTDQDRKEIQAALAFLAR